MNTSDTIAKIAAALLKAQRAITFAVKDSKNPAFRSSYADLSSVIEACKPALNDAGIAFMQMPAPSDPGTIALTTRLIHESGEWIESTATCPLQKVDPQGYGSANTYLRRYSLAAAVGLYQDDDDGNAASKKPAAPKPGVISSTGEAFNSLSPDWQAWIIEFARDIDNTFEQQGAQAAADLFNAERDSEQLEAEHIAATWGKVSSKARSAIKALAQKAA